MKTHSDTLRVGIIGYGQGRTYAASLHSLLWYYPELPKIELTSLVTTNESQIQHALKYEEFKRVDKDYQTLLQSDDIDLVIIATPPNLHAEMTSQALDSGKGVFVDKPVALNLTDSTALLQQARYLKKDARLGFQFRFCPALQFAKEYLESGKLGEIYSYRTTYFRSSYADPNRPLGWKGDLDICGDGVLYDYGPHPIDLAIWLVNMPSRLTAERRLFIPSRPVAKNALEMTSINTADHYLLCTSHTDGPIGSIEMGRLAYGADNELTVEIYASRGALRWSLMDPNFLYLCEHDTSTDRYGTGWIRVPTIQKYDDSSFPGGDTPMGFMRFHITSMADFIQSYLNGKSYDPGLLQGTRVQAVMEAATRAVEEENWQDVPWID